MCLNNISAQDKYFVGYYINSNEEKINCQIHYLDWDKNPESITVIQNGAEKELLPKDVQLIEIDGKKRYSGKLIKYATNPKEFKRLLTTKEIQWKEKFVFIEHILSGELNLFRYRDDKDILHFFSSRSSGPLEELLEIKFKEDNNVFKIDRYKNQVRKLMFDAPNVLDNINSLDFEEKAFRKVFEAYNTMQNHNNEATYVQSVEKVKLRISPLIGLSQLNFKSVTPIENKTNNLFFGARFDFVLPRNFHTLSVFSEVIPYNFKVDYVNTTYDIKYIRWNNGIKKVLTNKKVKFGVELGFYYAFLNSDINILKSEYGGFIGLNANMADGSLAYRYEKSDFFSPLAISVRTSTHFLEFSYALVKMEL